MRFILELDNDILRNLEERISFLHRRIGVKAHTALAFESAVTNPDGRLVRQFLSWTKTTSAVAAGLLGGGAMASLRPISPHELYTSTSGICDAF